MNDKQLLISGTTLSVLALTLAGSALLSVNSLSKSVNLLAAASSALGKGECALTTERPCYELAVGSNHVMLPAQAGEKELLNALSVTQALVSTLLCNPSDNNIVWGDDNIVWGSKLELTALATLKGDRTLMKFEGTCNNDDNIVWGD